MNRYLLDTHVWVWAQRREVTQLRDESFAEIEGWQKEGIVFISPFSAWELGLLERHKQIELGAPVEIFVASATEDDGLQFAALTPAILIASTRLPGDIHRDPADRILAATARELGLTLVTRDKALLAYAKQGHLNARKP